MKVEIKSQFILMSELIDGIVVHHKYIGYTVEESKELFTKYLKEYKKNK
jgi:hypothetical protein